MFYFTCDRSFTHSLELGLYRWIWSQTVVLVELVVGGEARAVVDAIGVKRQRERGWHNKHGVDRSITGRCTAQSPVSLPPVSGTAAE